MPEHIFYFAEGHVVSLASADQYQLWLLDHGNLQKVNDYLDGKIGVPANEVVAVNRGYTTETPGPQGEIHFAEELYEPLTVLQRGLPISQNIRGRVAIAKELWNQVPEAARPLPPNRDQDYRLRLVWRSGASTNPNAGASTGGGVTAFIGYHAQILATSGSQQRVLFFDWENGVLGDAWVALTDPVFDPPANGQTTLGTPSHPTEGALFVSLAAIHGEGPPGSPNLSFMTSPKVPRGAGR